MKANKIFLGFALMMGLMLSIQANGQAVIVRDEPFKLSGLTPSPLPALSTQHVTTPSGNHNFILDFQLPEGNPFIPSEEVGEVVYLFYQSLMGLWWEGELYINSDGKVKVRLRSKK